ncbi:MAG: hypothetical protein KDC90_13330 [Ignavibacteriae bacterium]|nr:hypothetical protein [Ignavibacteriota bacterium]
MEKYKVFLGNEDQEKINTLSDKILNMIDGYTINQIKKSFDKVETTITLSRIL